MFELNAITFINLFLVPVISLVIFLKKNLVSKNYFDTFLCYCILCVCNLVVTRVPLVLLRRALHIDLQRFTATYTAIAALCAFALPYIYLFLKKYINIKCEIKGKNEDSQ